MKISKELAKGSTGLLVLSVISKTDMYGYQIIKTLEVMSENVFSLNEGTLTPFCTRSKKRVRSNLIGAKRRAENANIIR